MGWPESATYRSVVNDRDDYLKALGRRVRDMRSAASLTQEALGERAGVSAKYVSAIESGVVNVSIGVLRDIAADGFGLSMAAFLAFDIEPDEAGRLEAEIVSLLVGLPVDSRRRALRALDAFFSRD